MIYPKAFAINFSEYHSTTNFLEQDFTAVTIYTSSNMAFSPK